MRMCVGSAAGALLVGWGGFPLARGPGAPVPWHQVVRLVHTDVLRVPRYLVGGPGIGPGLSQPGSA